MKLKFLWFLAFANLFFLFALYNLFSWHLLSFPTPITHTQLITHSPPSSQTITLLAVGDIMLGRSVNAKMRKLNDFTYPFLKTSDFLKSADLTFGNLESPLVSGCPTTDTGMVFCADPKAVKGLKLAGFDILNLTNNHILNFGVSGLEQTIALLETNKIHPIGSLPPHYNNIYYYSAKDLRLAFVGYNLTALFNREKIKTEIRETKNKVDVLVLSLHWGNEYQNQPNPEQKKLAYEFLDAGADLILGYHPHVIQETEEYTPPHQNIGGGGKGKLIVYSLGNFIFDQPWSEETKKGLVGIFTFQNKKLIKTEFKKIYIRDYSQPEFLPD